MPRPRVHDLRHASLAVVASNGAPVDLGPRIAALATDLGHSKVSDTYWYLTETSERLAFAAKRFEDLAIAPELLRDRRHPTLTRLADANPR